MLTNVDVAPTPTPIQRSNPSRSFSTEEIHLPQIVISFDVEEHFRIEAAAGLTFNSTVKAHYCERVEPSTRWLLDQLEKAEVKATFFVLGEIGRDNPSLVKAIHRSGHE